VVRTTRRSAAHVPEEGGRQDRFARAVDGGVREVSDQSMERELAIVAALRETGDAAGPSRDEVDRMRSRVMAGATGLHRDTGDRMSAGTTGLHRDHGDRVRAMPSRHRARHAKPASVAAEARGRIVVAAAAALCLLMSLSGMSLLLSRDALPGDTLYAFKRSAESAELGLTFGDESRALKHLEFASARMSEIERLAAQADGSGTGGSGAAQFLAALDDFDSDTIAGTRLLTGLAADGDLDHLSSLHGWAQQQQERLDDVRAALPADAASRIDSTLALLEQVQQRAAALQDRAGCQNVTASASDQLGPLPAEESCQPVPLDDAASAVPLVPTPKTAAPATPGGSAAPTTPAPDGQAQDGLGGNSLDHARLRDVLPQPDGEDRPWEPTGEDGPWPGREASPDSRRLVIPLPLLPDASVSAPNPAGPEPR
jgi:hypothetical protein